MTREIELTNIENFRLDIRAGDRQVIADESVAAGGGGEGFDPFELFISGIAACEAVTIVAVCKNEKINLEKFSISAIHKTNIAITGPNDPRRYRARIVLLRMTIKLYGSLTTDEIEKIAKSIEGCPLGNTIRPSVKLTHKIECVTEEEN